MGGANSRNQEKGYLLDINLRVFKYSFQIRRNEKYDVHRKMFDTLNFAFTKIYFICLYYITKIKSHFALLSLKTIDFA